jgi:hypothetical protein
MGLLKQEPSSNKVKNNILPILFILIFGLNWFMNIGWIRIIFAIPMLFHAILFYFSTRAYHRLKSKDSKSMKLVIRSVYATYLLSYALLLDGGDAPNSMSVFFGLIKNETFIDVAAPVSEISLVANLVLITFLLIYKEK